MYYAGCVNPARIIVANVIRNPIVGSMPVGRRIQGLGGAAAQEVLVEERRLGQRPGRRRRQEGPRARQQSSQGPGQGVRRQIQVS